MKKDLLMQFSVFRRLHSLKYIFRCTTFYQIKDSDTYSVIMSGITIMKGLIMMTKHLFNDPQFQS